MEQYYYRSMTSPMSAEVLATDDGAVVVVTIYGEAFTGAAKTHPHDKPGTPEIGRDLAFSRALLKASRTLKERAYANMRETTAKKAKIKKLHSRGSEIAKLGRSKSWDEWQTTFDKMKDT